MVGKLNNLCLLKSGRKKAEDGAAIRFQLPDKPEMEEGDCDGGEEDVQILHDIVERGFDGAVRAPSMQQTSAGQRHFPDVIALPLINNQEENLDKKSLFARQFQEMKASLGKEDSGHQSQQGRSVDVLQLGDNSRLLSGTGESSKVHEENLARLQDVSEDEVMEEQRKLLASMDPSLVEWLRSKKGMAGVHKSCEPMDDTVRESSTGPEERSTTNNPDEDIASQPLHQYPGMEIAEEDKLSWTGDLPPLTSSSSELSKLSARFALDGALLPHDTEIPVQAGLHHHGEEPARAGYTVGELLTLARSSHPRQVVLGLEVLAQLLSRIGRGELDGCFHQNLVGELVKAGLVHILRVSLDSSTKDILQASAGCLAALLSSQEQEALQDWLPSSLHPALAPVDPLPSPVEEMADQALVEADTVLGLVRMDLVERSAYLISRKDTEKTVIVSLLSCLVRVARHSKNMASKLANHRIVTTLLSPHLPYLPVALKLVRVICAQSRELAQILLDRLRLEATMAPLLARESTEMEEVAVCVEAHRLWVVLLAYGQTLSLWDQLAPVVLQRLVAEYRSEGASSRLGAWVIEVGGRVAMCRQVDGLEQLLANCLRKWLGQLFNCEEQLGDVQRAVQVAAAARALGRLYQAHIDKEETELGPVMARMETLLSSTLLPFIASPHFVLLLSSLKSKSGFLSGLKTADVSPPSLPGLGLAVQAGALHPAVAAPHVLLLEGVCGLLALVRQLLGHFWQPPPAMAPPYPTLVAYLTALSSSPSLSLTCHPLSRGETHLVHHLLRLYSPAIPAIAHSSALTLASLVQTGDSHLLQDLFDNYIFSPSLLSTSSLSTKFSSLALAPSALLPASGQPAPPPSQVLEESLANLPSLRAAYASLLSSPKPVAPDKIQSLSTPPDTLLPSDWPFLPLLSLYHSSSSSTAPLSAQQVQWALAWLALLPPSPPTPTFLRLSTLQGSPLSPAGAVGSCLAC